MAVYDPSDPLGWKWIKAEQDAGLNAAGGTNYVTPGFGDDPEFLAYLTQYQLGQTQAAADAELRRRNAKDDYEQALRALEQQGVQSATSNDTSLLARGVFNSGERLNDQNDIRAALTQGREQADTQLSRNLGGIDSDLQRALTQLDMERERQIVASKARVADAQRQGAIEAGVYGGGGSGGSGGSSTPQVASSAPAPRTPAQQQSAQNQQRAITYSQTYQNPGAGRGRGGYGPVNAKPNPTTPTTPPRPRSGSNVSRYS